MTFNIRYDNPKDAPNDWASRKGKVCSQIRFHAIGILGVQEALAGQVRDLEACLPGFQRLGVGRDDGREAGEFSCLFVDTALYAVLQSETFWLSPTPRVPGSKGWDAAITRIVTWAQLQHRSSGQIFWVFNTHFDHQGREARRQSAALLLRTVDSLAGSEAAVVLGDFNAAPADEPMRILTEAAPAMKLTYARDISLAGHYGPTGTFNAFGRSEVNDDPIDHILLRGKWRVLQHATLSQTWGGLFSSDHFPVMAVLEGPI